jgi:hypothetical protein
MEVTGRTARFISRRVMNQLYAGDLPSRIPQGGKLLFLESSCPESGMGIGDSVCKIPAILAIAKKFQAQVDVVVSSNRTDLWRNIANSQISEVIPVE